MCVLFTETIFFIYFIKNFDRALMVYRCGLVKLYSQLDMYALCRYEPELHVLMK